MPSTYTLNNGIELIATGEQSGTWGNTTNTNLELLDTALDGQVTVTLASAGSSGSPNTLPISDGAASNGRNRMVIFNDGSDLGATAYVQLTPNDAEKIIYVRNSLSGSRSILLFQGTYNASNDYEVPAGTTAVIYFDGAGTGAVAANVFNNAYFDSLRLGSVSVTAILDEDNMASDSATALATQQSIKAYVDTQVGANNELSEVLANGNTTGGTDIAVSTGDDITFADNSKAIFGAGSDLQIYHNANNSYVQDVGTGKLHLTSDGTGVSIDKGTSELMATFDTDGAVTLYYDNAAKLATTSTGVDITGTAVTDGVTVAGNLSVDGGTIKLDGNYPTGTNNVALGDSSLNASVTGTRNTALGNKVLSGLTSGAHNVALGDNAGNDISSGSYNVAVGSASLDAATTASNNTAVGYQALSDNSSGEHNVAIGANAGDDLTTGSDNVAVGSNALSAVVTGSNNVAVGRIAMRENSSGAYNTAIGSNALLSNTTASNNTAVGYQAAYSNTTGYDSVGIGYQALYGQTTGGDNTAVGVIALKGNTTGTNNVAMGAAALDANTTGSYNTALGRHALGANTTASYNTAVGYRAIYSNTTGIYNVAMGNDALYSNTQLPITLLSVCMA